MAVCTLIVGGISIIDQAGATEFIQFEDPFTTNLAFGGADMRDTWATSSSAAGRLLKVRWPYPRTEAGLFLSPRGASIVGQQAVSRKTCRPD